MRPNTLRDLLDSGQPSVGTHILVSWPGVVELVGQTGVIDYVEFVGEYAPYDLYALENIGRAIELFDHLSGMMKVEQEPRTHLAIRSIGSGIQNILFADVHSADEAADCVAAVRAETPSTGGHHGAGSRRDIGYGWEKAGGGKAFVQALEDSVVALMIEKDGAVKDIENILALKGVDMIQFGPGRLRHEHRSPRRILASPLPRGGRAHHQNRARHGQASARRDQLARPG